jgi:hypothetical protein
MARDREMHALVELLKMGAKASFQSRNLTK